MIHELLAGGTAGAIGVAFGNPLDVIKVRMQTTPDKYYSPQQTIQMIWKQEGFFGFYKGMSSPLAAQFIMNSVLFGTNSLVMSILNDYNPNAPYNSFISGCSGGIAQCIILVPTDVIKCSMQIDSANRNFFKPVKATGALNCARMIIKGEGLAGLFKGFGATALREVPAFGIYFTTYNQTVRFLNHQNIDNTNISTSTGTSVSTSIASKPSSSSSSSSSTVQNAPPPSTASVLFSGGLAGSLSWLVIYPVDVVKSNIQATNIHTPSSSSLPSAAVTTASKGFFSTAKNLQRKYGWQVFTRGLGITLLRAFPVNAAVFFFYEQFRSHLAEHHPV